jgi:hypothetical protein
MNEVQMADSGRNMLREQQDRLVQALTVGSPPPEGFDPDRIGLAARTLINKRMRAVKKAWPGLAQGLGTEFENLFADYARERSASEQGAAADAEAFARHLRQTGRLEDEAFVELLARRARRGFPIQIGRLPESGRRVVVVRVPWRGVLVWPRAISAR